MNDEIREMLSSPKRHKRRVFDEFISTRVDGVTRTNLEALATVGGVNISKITRAILIDWLKVNYDLVDNARERIESGEFDNVEEEEDSIDYANASIDDPEWNY
jgi:hypothetical protein